MSKQDQLWALTDKECRLFGYLEPTGPKLRKASKVPIMHWPDGTVCWPVTVWLVECSKDKFNDLNRGKRGGTLTTYASLISALVRYVDEINVAFESLTDDNIFDWVERLKKEPDRRSSWSPRRKMVQIGRIVRQALYFLLWYQGYFLQTHKLIGTSDDYQIRVSHKEGRGKRSYNFTYIHHRAIPKEDVSQEVKPIGHGNISLLYDAVVHSTDNIYVRKRRQNTLRLLEAMGGRRIELPNITLEDIKRAHKTGKLTLWTAKQNGHKTREIPIHRNWLEPISMFIDTHRKRLVKGLIKEGIIEKDSGYLLLGSKGEKISEETITREINRLAKIAGINEKVCPHMFRHRFVTIQVAIRLKEYGKQELPMDVAHTILVKVATLTGHSDPRSLEPYIHLAFAELSDWDTAERVLRLRSGAEALHRQLQTFAQELEETHDPQILLSAIEVLKDTLSLPEWDDPKLSN